MIPTFKTFVSEESPAYEKAWDKHRAEIAHLQKHGFEAHWDGGRDAQTGDSKKGAQRRIRGKVTSGLHDEHQQAIYWRHDNYKRKNHTVVTHETHIQLPNTPNSRQVGHTHEVAHKNLKAAVTYLNKKKKELSAK